MLDAVRDIRIEDPGIGLLQTVDYAHRAFWSRVHAWAGQLFVHCPGNTA